MLLLTLTNTFLLIQIASSLSLYPKDSLTRQSKKLDGIWDFRIAPNSNPEKGFEEKWFGAPLSETGSTIPMPVPASFNDITQDKSIRDHVGWVWYSTEFYIPSNWKSDTRDVLLRFSSVNYYAIVYFNGKQVATHEGGHLPFECDITHLLTFRRKSFIVVAINNTLTHKTIPQGLVTYKANDTLYPKNFYQFKAYFDFFNYAGIHRSVYLYSVPKNRIKNFQLKTLPTKNVSTIELNYKIDYAASNTVNCHFILYTNNSSSPQIRVNNSVGSIKIDSNEVHLWWPVGMHENPGFLYSVDIFLYSSTSIMLDHYPIKLGIRTVALSSKNQLLINNNPVYLTGFGKHEDSDIFGRAINIPIMVKDFNLIKWIGANSFRTSHYPYSEELMDLADELGILVIDECPAVSLQSFDENLLKLHSQMIEELILRDQNHASVIMWSIANEPRSYLPESDAYFANLTRFAKQLDSSRLITAAINAEIDQDYIAEHLDVIMINRYNAWYSDTGYTQTITKVLINYIHQWLSKLNKPILISEYGADTIAGLHNDPSFVFTEDYQVELIMNHLKAFDELKKNPSFIGEMIWNFADFMTNQDITRVLGNKKGIFTRQRQPKASAKLLRCRYRTLNNLTLDDNMYCFAS